MTNKVNIKPQSIMYPSPAVIVSAYDSDGKADACTIAFVSMCSRFPPCLMIAIDSTAKRKTLKDILETKEFVVGFPNIEQVSETDYLGIASGYDEDKLEKVSFTTRKSMNVYAPIINELKVSVECKAINIIEVGSHTQITGEIINILVDDDLLVDGSISMKLLNPIAYDMVLHDYFEIGEKVDDAFECGLKFIK